LRSRPLRPPDLASDLGRALADRYIHLESRILDLRPERTTAMASIQEEIRQEVTSNDVVLFMKGTPQMPMCGFSGQVVQILDYLGVPYKGINVLANDEIRQGIKDFANWPTIPQLYIKGEFVGGCDIVREMFQSGELASHLSEQGVACNQPDKA
jgi:monothiol glutaredoxin